MISVYVSIYITASLRSNTCKLIDQKGVARGKKKLTIRWTKPKGTNKYIFYGNLCNSKGKKYKYVKIRKFNSKSKKYKYVKIRKFNSKSKKYTLKKINKKKLKKGRYYKFVIAAVDKNGKVIAISKTVHVTTNGGKKGNDKSVKRVKPTKKAKQSVKIKKTKKLKVKEVRGKKKVARHRAVCWESSNTSIVTVSKKGKVTGKKKGTCTIYAYAQNGVYTTFKITVK